MSLNCKLKLVLPKQYLYSYKGQTFDEALASYLLRQHTYNLVYLYHYFCVSKLKRPKAVIHTALNRGHSWSRGQIFRGIKRKWNTAEDYIYMESQL